MHDVYGDAAPPAHRHSIVSFVYQQLERHEVEGAALQRCASAPGLLVKTAHSYELNKGDALKMEMRHVMKLEIELEKELKMDECERVQEVNGEGTIATAHTIGRRRSILHQQARRAFRRRHRRITRLETAADSQPPLLSADPAITARLKKRPSLFLRILNRAMKEQRSQELVTRVPWWRFTRIRASRELAGYHPSLVSELLRYYGTDTVKKQLLPTMDSREDKHKTFIHHPINPLILSSRHLKTERERSVRGKLPAQSKRSFLSLRRSRLESASQIRLMNRHGENWKLLEFAQAGGKNGPPMGLGGLRLADFLPPTTQRRITSKYTSIEIPPRISSLPGPYNQHRPTTMRRTSVSTIGWTESIVEFEGDLGSVHVSGERKLLDVDQDLQHQLLLPPPPPLTSAGIRRSSSWSLEAASALNEIITTHTVDSHQGTASAAVLADDLSPSPARIAAKNVVVSGHWEAALQMMQEFETDAQSQSKISTSSSKRRRGTSSRARTWSKSSTRYGAGSTYDCVNRYPEGHVDQELRDVCKMAVMSRRTRRAASAGDITSLRHPLTAGALFN
ncbi:hypothetical protein BZA05DRAFT_161576 [Tricharina praecox]|uniref:uncharacterized protein n=1 Tax=Tricharina praecox TaxID=43433 RepID=UPI0022204365|nr:uncharacterized protein BZA05DRAFT_161576 [Tricharina praecox]KAI5856911.1 hypothetical protein BZA05DRAFT_161576 [Tricharina praecox]